MAKTLQLQFGAANGKSLMLTVDEPKESLTQVEIQAGMNAVAMFFTLKVHHFQS